MNYESNPKSIKYHVKKYLYRHRKRFSEKKIIDLPTGNGTTCQIIQDIGSIPLPFDLFTEYFKIKSLSCQRANIISGIPLDSATADMVICQEGIEHFSDQYKAFKEFNRVLKEKGVLLLTTPNYSNLRAKLSYLLTESERFNDIMPPNEIDSVWMSNQKIIKEIYFGHIFLIGIQKLRVLAKLAGFKISRIQFVRAKSTATLLLPVFYPFIFLSSWFTYRKNIKRHKGVNDKKIRKIYQEIFRLAVNPKILIDSHLMVEFEKEMDYAEVASSLSDEEKDFGIT